MRYIIILLLATSCGPTFYLKKADKALKKAEQLGAVINKDTVWMEVPLFIPEVEMDTIIKINNITDTIRIVDTVTKIETKIKYNPVTKTVYVRQVSPADTVYVEVPVKVETKIKAGKSTWELITAFIMGIVIGFLIAKLFTRT